MVISQGEVRWAVLAAPGNLLLSTRVTGLPKDAVANVSQLVTLDRFSLTERVGTGPLISCAQ